MGEHVSSELGEGAASVRVLALRDPEGAKLIHVLLHLVEGHCHLAGMVGLVFELVRALDDQLS